MTEHPDLEALSAYADGEAPEEAAHVSGCASCRATVDELRSVSVAVGAPVEPPPAGQREIAVAAAITAGLEARARQDAQERRRRGTPGRWLWPVAGLAALILVAVGFMTLMTNMDGGSSHGAGTALAGRAPESAPSLAGPGPGAGPSADGSAASSAAGVPPPDLGDIPDPPTLSARARAALAQAPATGTAQAPAPVAAPATNPAPVAGSRAALPAPAVVGTRPCEEQARTRQPSLGPVVFFATARRGGVPAVVLGFSSGPGASPASDPSIVSLQLLAQDGCAELLRAAGP